MYCSWYFSISRTTWTPTRHRRPGRVRYEPLEPLEGLEEEEAPTAAILGGWDAACHTSHDIYFGGSFFGIFKAWNKKRYQAICKTFGAGVNRSLEGVTFPSNLESLVFGFWSWLWSKTWRSDLSKQTSEFNFWLALKNQSLEQVKLPSNLQSPTFGQKFSHSLEWVNLPSLKLDIWLGL